MQLFCAISDKKFIEFCFLGPIFTKIHLKFDFIDSGQIYHMF